MQGALKEYFTEREWMSLTTPMPLTTPTLHDGSGSSDISDMSDPWDENWMNLPSMQAHPELIQIEWEIRQERYSVTIRECMLAWRDVAQRYRVFIAREMLRAWRDVAQQQAR